MKSPASPDGYGVVIVGTDGSESAGRAVEHASRLAHAHGARLVVVTAYNTDVDGPEDAESAPSDIKWTMTLAGQAEAMAQHASEWARSLGVESISVRAVAGEAASVILDVADEMGADLIVVGSRGMTSPSRFILGSVPNAISHHGKCDVLIVRTD